MLARPGREYGVDIGAPMNPQQVVDLHEGRFVGRQIQIAVGQCAGHRRETFGAFGVTIAGAMVEHVSMGVEGGLHATS